MKTRSDRKIVSKKTVLIPARRGLSLFEVVIAATILAGSFAMLSQLIDVGQQASLRTSLELQGLVRAETVLDELVAGVTEVVTTGPSAFTDDPNWTYEVVVENGYQNLSLDYVFVRVTHVQNNGMQNARVELSRLIYVPVVLESAEEAL